MSHTPMLFLSYHNIHDPIYPIFLSFISFILYSIIIFYIFYRRSTTIFSPYRRDLPLHYISSGFDLSYIPNRPKKKFQKNRRQYYLHRRSKCRFDPPLYPTSKFQPIPFNDILASTKHHYLHEPTFHYGYHFDQFSLDPLVYVRMLQNFHILQHNDPIPTFSYKNYGSFLECTDSAFAFSNFIQTYPLVLDTGASISITPVLSDFVTDLQPPPVQTVHGINSSTKVEGSGTVEWQVTDTTGTIRTIRTFALYIPTAKVRLFSPQDFLRISNNGTVHITKTDTRLYLDCNITASAPILFEHNIDNGLPMIISDMVRYQPSAYIHLSVPNSTYFTYNVNLTLQPDNTTLSLAQKELLMWHFKLGHVNMRWIQQLLRQRDWLGPMTEPYGNAITEHHSYLPTSNKKSSTCDPPLCTACIMAKSSR